MKRKKNGFTLIELLIVVVILGLLATLVLPNLFKKGEKAKKSITCIKMKNIKNTIEEFKSDNGTYPSTREGLAILVSNSNIDKYKNYSEAGYLEKIPTDAWGTNIMYIKENSKYTLISYGADKEEGGKAFDADFKLSDCK